MTKVDDLKKEIKGKEEKKVCRVYAGDVVSDKMDKTVVVKVVRSVSHPRIHKIVRMSKKYKVHDEDNSAKIGDVVEFCECRPISKCKSMKLVKIVKSGV